MLSDTFKTENLKVLNSLHACSEFNRIRKIGMTEHQWKELSKYFLDNGNRKLSTEEKERIKVNGR